MPLRQLGVIRTEDHRDVAELGRREAERLVNQQLPRRIRDVILASHHMRHPHQPIVDDDREVVGGIAVGTQQHLVADDVGVKADVSAHQIGERDSRDSPACGIGQRPAPRLARAFSLHRIETAARARNISAGDCSRAPLFARPRAARACRSSSTRGRFEETRARATGIRRDARTSDTGRRARRLRGPRPNRVRAIAGLRESSHRIRRSNARRRCPRCAE